MDSSGERTWGRQKTSLSKLLFSWVRFLAQERSLGKARLATIQSNLSQAAGFW